MNIRKCSAMRGLTTTDFSLNGTVLRWAQALRLIGTESSARRTISDIFALTAADISISR